MGYLEEYNAWLISPALSDDERGELRAIEGDDNELKSRFWGQLEFGTAGLRGIMGAGLQRMNVHVIRHTTQALAMLINEEPADNRSIAICYDTRTNSESFAREAACVMAANGVKTLIFDSPRPTPELSFAIRHYGCTAGINITASHNPKEYNGYKVYWSDGAQLPPHHSEAVAKRMLELDIFTSVKTMDYDAAAAAGLIVTLGGDTDEAFLRCVMGQVSDFDTARRVADTFKLVYTPFHGVGRILVPEALGRLGLKHVICEPQQMIPDGTFPTVTSPNPENPEGFYLAVELAERHGADLIIGTDPDADRVGILARDKSGGFVPISGNQTGVLLLDYLIGAKRRAGTLPERPVTLKTIVTTEMARRVAEQNNVRCFDTFTGFKFMAEKQNALETSGDGTVFFAFEESYGYMIGDFVRDKDAVTATVLIAEMAAWYYAQGMTLLDAMQSLYEKYGYYAEKTVNLMAPGLDGRERMQKLMDALRNNPPTDICGTLVKARRDYESGTETDAASGGVTAIELKGSNVLRYELADGAVILIRPSGTEPKIKVYILAQGKTGGECAQKTAEYASWAEQLMPGG